LKIALLGFGAIGKQRLNAIRRLQSEGLQVEQIDVYDPFVDVDKRDVSLTWYDSIEEISSIDHDWYIIATPHHVSVPLAKRIIPTGSKILIEKPFGRTLEEAQDLYDSMQYLDQIYVGFNYRFFEGVARLIEDVGNNFFGDIVSINMILAHGGSPSDAFGWKCDPNQVGSGALLDPGIHLLDILQFITIHDPKILVATQWKGFWNVNIVEESHLLMKDENYPINLQVSLVRWLSEFQIYVNGIDGYGIVKGKGGSYGNQSYVRGNRWGWAGTNKRQKETEELVLTSDCSNSFYYELDALLNNNSDKYTLYPCSAYEAVECMKLYNKCMKVIV
jgi:predicted dehydrogenase